MKVLTLKVIILFNIIPVFSQTQLECYGNIKCESVSNGNSSNQFKYCYDGDNTSKLKYIVNGFQMIIDSSIIDSTILINTYFNDTIVPDLSIKYFVKDYFKNITLYNGKLNERFKVKYLPSDSMIMIWDILRTYTSVLIPYKDFYRKHIIINFPFYDKSDKIIRGQHLFKSKKRVKIKKFKVDCLECMILKTHFLSKNEYFKDFK